MMNLMVAIQLEARYCADCAWLRITHEQFDRSKWMTWFLTQAFDAVGDVDL